MLDSVFNSEVSDSDMMAGPPNKWTLGGTPYESVELDSSYSVIPLTPKDPYPMNPAFELILPLDFIISIREGCLLFCFSVLYLANVLRFWLAAVSGERWESELRDDAIDILLFGSTCRWLSSSFLDDLSVPIFLIIEYYCDRLTLNLI